MKYFLSLVLLSACFTSAYSHAPRCARNAHKLAQATRSRGVTTTPAAATPVTHPPRITTSPAVATPVAHPPRIAPSNQTIKTFNSETLSLFTDFARTNKITHQQATKIFKRFKLDPSPLKSLNLPRQITLKHCHPTVEIIPTNSQMITDGDTAWSCGFRALFNACKLVRDAQAELDGSDVEEEYELWYTEAYDYIEARHKEFVAAAIKEDDEFDTGELLHIDYLQLLLDHEVNKENDPEIKEALRRICVISKTSLDSVAEGSPFVTNQYVTEFRNSRDPEKQLIVIMLYGSHYKTFLIQDPNKHEVALFQTDSLISGQCRSIPHLWRYIWHQPLLSEENWDYLRLILPKVVGKL